MPGHDIFYKNKITLNCGNLIVQGIDNESDAAFSMVTDNTARLTSAVNSLPQLLEKKRLIDMHTTVASGKYHKSFVFVLIGWSLLSNALRSFQIYCASLNLGIRT